MTSNRPPHQHQASHATTAPSLVVPSPRWPTRAPRRYRADRQPAAMPLAVDHPTAPRAGRLAVSGEVGDVSGEVSPRPERCRTNRQLSEQRLRPKGRQPRRPLRQVQPFTPQHTDGRCASVRWLRTRRPHARTVPRLVVGLDHSPYISRNPMHAPIVARRRPGRTVSR